MQSKERSILQSLAANSAFVAVLVIAVSELLALLRSMRLLPAKPDAALAKTSAEPTQKSNIVQTYGRVSRNQNRRGEKASRRKEMFSALTSVDSRGGRERRAMRGRRASDFATAGMTHS